MQIGMIQGFTRIIGQSQGYLGLPIRDITINCSVNGPNTPAMETAWLPTPAEIVAIEDGAPIILRLFGRGHPPVMMRTGDAPDGEGIRTPARMTLPGARFRLEDRVRKLRGSSWQGLVVGFYSTRLTPIGYAVESEREPGSVQIYPESALELVPEQAP